MPRVGLIAAVLFVFWAPSLSVSALSVTETDPDDVNLRVDVKTVSVANDATSVTYTVEAYEAFPDAFADFRWGIDKDADQDFDYFVSVEFDRKLIGKVEDAQEESVAEAIVTRPSPNSLRVSIPATVLRGVTSYGYSLRALTDLNENGEADPGEQDLAPNTGLYQHRLEAAPGTSPAAPPPVATPAPAPPPAPVAGPPRTATAATPPSAERPAAAPVPAAPKAAPTPAAPKAAPAPAEAPKAMARTGSEHVWLGLVGMGLLLAGVPGFFFRRKAA